MVRAMVNQTTSNSHSHSIQETGTARLKTTSSTLSPSTRKSDRSLVSFFPTEVAESEFRSQPVATAVSSAESVDKTFVSTSADAHFSRAHITAHSSYSTAFVPMWGRCFGSRWKESMLRMSQHSLPLRFPWPCWAFLCPFLSGHVFTCMLLSRPSASSTSFCDRMRHTYFRRTQQRSCLVSSQRYEGACGRSGGHHSRCVAACHWSVWFPGWELRQR